METMEASIDEVFEKLFPTLAEHSGWNVLSSWEDVGSLCSISSKPCQINFSDGIRDVTLIQFAFVFAAQYRAIPRPDSMGQKEIVVRDSTFESGKQLLKLNGPGDGLLQVQVRYKRPAAKMLSLSQTPDEHQPRPYKTSDTVIVSSGTFRYIVRQDYPSAKQSSLLFCRPSTTNADHVVLVGTGDSGMEIWEELPGGPQDLQCRSFSVLCQCGDVSPELPQLRHFFGIKQAAVKSLLLSQSMAKWMQRDATQDARLRLQLQTVETRTQASDDDTHDADFYIAFAIKNCSRGLPLRPVFQEEYLMAPQADRVQLADGFSKYWVRTGQNGFHLPTYLTELMNFLGLEIRVSGTLEGRVLKSYHAILPRSCWQEVSEEFAALWAEQRAAYRRLNGGTSAPLIREIHRDLWMAKTTCVTSLDLEEEGAKVQ